VVLALEAAGGSARGRENSRLNTAAKGTASPDKFRLGFKAFTFAVPSEVLYDSREMTNSTVLRCDGCGQIASPEHISRRLQRLEWATRSRPIHIGTLFLAAVAPAGDSEFLYAPNAGFVGEAGLVLQAAGIIKDSKTLEAVLGEFQRRGFFLAHVLECAPDRGSESLEGSQRLIEQRLNAVMARVRRSLKPKRLVPISSRLGPALQQLSADQLGCAIVRDGDQFFALDGEQCVEAARRLHDLLARASGTTVSAGV
jgi:hypothetical protein